MKIYTVALIGLLACSGWAAGIPEPFNLVYGVVELGGGRATSASSHVVIEARRFATGGAFASYRMGTDVTAGDYYVMKLHLESRVAGSTIGENASSVGDTVYLTVIDGTQVVDQLAYTLGPRGTVFRIDFGNVDDDEDGLPDGWEQAYLYSMDFGQDDDPDADGLSNLNEFLLGRNPLIADALHPADINPADGRITIQEASAYYTAWRNGVDKWVQTLSDGTEVSRGPVPIPVTYVTRATFLWEQGEYYTLDIEAGEEPLWWVTTPAPEQGNLGSLAVADFSDRRSAALAEEGIDSEFRTLLEGLPSSETTKTSESKLASRSLTGGALMTIRTTGPAGYSMDDIVGITNEIHIAPGLRTYAVERQLPEGWDLVSIESSGHFDLSQRIVRWGPYFDRQPRTLVYYMTPKNPLLVSADLGGDSAYDGHQVEFLGSSAIYRLPENPGEIVLLPKNSLREWTLLGQPGGRYAIQSSSDLKNWTTIHEDSAGDSGQIEFQDDANGVPSRFFRAMRLPSNSDE